MKKIFVTISKGPEDYGAWAENVEGIYGAGNTPEEAKQSILDAIELFKQHNTKLPAVLAGKYEIIYKMDMESVLNYYKGLFTKSGLEKITGINQKQLQHYASGLKKPRTIQKEKLRTALHKLGEELLSVQL